MSPVIAVRRRTVGSAIGATAQGYLYRCVTVAHDSRRRDDFLGLGPPVKGREYTAGYYLGCRITFAPGRGVLPSAVRSVLQSEGGLLNPRVTRVIHSGFRTAFSRLGRICYDQVLHGRTDTLAVPMLVMPGSVRPGRASGREVSSEPPLSFYPSSVQRD